MTVLRLREQEVEWRLVEGQVIVFNTRRLEYFGLNEAGGLLWKALSAGSTPQALTAALQAGFGIDESQATHDVESFLELLRAHEVVDEQ